MEAAAPPWPPIERLRIERRGGLAGLRPSADRAWASLTADQQRAVQHLLDSRVPVPAPVPPGADRFSYRLQLVHPDGIDRTLDFSEDAMPPALAALVRPGLR